MPFKDINQIKEKFQVNGSSFKELRSQLKTLLSQSHPDKTGGAFNSEEIKEKYNDIKEALEFLDNSSLPVAQNEITELTKVLSQLTFKQNVSETHQVLTTKIETSVSSFKKGHLFPKITTTTISLVLSTIWLFPDTIKDHPVLSQWIDINSYRFMIYWSGSIFITAYIWLILKIVENRDSNIKKSLNLETTQNKIFNQFIRWEVIGKKNVKKVSFTKDKLIHFIMDYDVRRETVRRFRSSLNRKLNDLFIFSIFPKAGELDIEIAQNLSDLLIERALSRNIIEKDSSKSLSDIYHLEYNEEEFERNYR